MSDTHCSQAITETSENESKKWMCEYCTYENFQSSLKCTMCKGHKPLLNEDIFRLSPSQEPGVNDVEASNLSLSSTDICGPSSNNQKQQISTQNQIQSPTNTNLKQWTCPKCTYLNWTKSSRCIQCSTPASPIANKNKLITNSPTTIKPNNNLIQAKNSDADMNAINEQLKAVQVSGGKSDFAAPTKIQQSPTPPPSLIIGSGTGNVNKICDESTGDDKSLIISSADVEQQQQQSVTEVASGNLLLKRTNSASPMGSATNLSGSRTNLGAAGARISPVEHQKSYPINKWSCTTCTFENWPKSLKCSMCGHGKELFIQNEQFGGSTNIMQHKQLQLSSPERDIINNEDLMNNCGAGNFIHSQHQQQQQHTTNNNKRNAANNHHNNHNRYQLGGSVVEPSNNCDSLQERRMRQMRRQADWQWLHACLGVVENNFSAVEAYLACGGNPGRSITSSEVTLLNRNSAFDVGITLIHLAIRFHREEMLPMLLAQISGSGPGIKRVPSYVAPDLAADIRRHFATSLRVRKAQFNCHYINEHATFALPAEIEELPISIQEQLHEELFDREAQTQLENSPPALNWSLEITARFGSRLMVLWNRSAGDCLLDSAMQATWGVFDRDNVLRRALADSLHQCGRIFYNRWKEYEMIQAALLNYTIEESQLQEDWATSLSLASQPGSSLDQLHIFAIAHILRRPIVVYGVKYVKSFRGEDIGYARFEGLYLPLLWEQSFCIKSPIALGYTRGHFSALVPTEPYSRIDAARVDSEDVTFLPLMDCEHKLLPIHFLTQSEMGREESIMRQWLDVCETESGLLVAQQKLHKRPLLVAQMLEEWLNHYRRIAQVMTAPFSRRGRPQPTTGYSSDGDTDEE